MLDTEMEIRSMIVTEMNAGNKICKIGGPEFVDYNNYSHTNSNQLNRFGFCVGSRCMHWEFLFREDEVSAFAEEERAKYPPLGRGFCGAVKSKLMVI